MAIDKERLIRLCEEQDTDGIRAALEQFKRTSDADLFCAATAALSDLVHQTVDCIHKDLGLCITLRFEGTKKLALPEGEYLIQPIEGDVAVTMSNNPITNLNPDINLRMTSRTLLWPISLKADKPCRVEIRRVTSLPPTQSSS